MWEILIIVCTYFILCGITFKIILTLRGYKRYSEVEGEDAPLIAFGTIFCPVALLILLGILIARFILIRLK